ncbi:hypothetical protein [Bifidobacterium gallicum]|uniref:hypothetical protein n=1 Tax=Bifidobacterium gallicum TaxID=78342 RepID=UPI0011DCCA6B|nr:hypothetical protein [Bifidobacterium gallicum]
MSNPVFCLPQHPTLLIPLSQLSLPSPLCQPNSSLEAERRGREERKREGEKEREEEKRKEKMNLGVTALNGGSCNDVGADHSPEESRE